MIISTTKLGVRRRFLYNADTQRTLTRNGETLLAALHFFNNSLNTLTNKTIEDTLLTIRQYEAARYKHNHTNTYNFFIFQKHLFSLATCPMDYFACGLKEYASLW